MLEELRIKTFSPQTVFGHSAGLSAWVFLPDFTELDILSSTWYQLSTFYSLRLLVVMHFNVDICCNVAVCCMSVAV